MGPRGVKGGDMKRTSRETALLKGRNTRTIQLPLKHLKGVGIGMTLLSHWLKVLPRGRGTAGVTELLLGANCEFAQFINCAAQFMNS